MYSYGSPHTAAQKQDDQHERTFSSYVRIQVVVLKTYLGAMNDREEWRERVRDIRAASTIWWWWWSIYVCVCVREREREREQEIEIECMYVGMDGWKSVWVSIYVSEYKLVCICVYVWVCKCVYVCESVYVWVSVFKQWGKRKLKRPLILFCLIMKF